MYKKGKTEPVKERLLSESENYDSGNIVGAIQPLDMLPEPSGIT